MPKEFEYTVIPLEDLAENENPDLLEQKLNENGKDGWEVATIVELQGRKFVIFQKER